jgi:PAS domain S-box-containing protein
MSPELRISLWYGLTSFIWIAISDRLVSGLLAQSPALVDALQTIKGIGFVLLTMLFLFFLLRREFGKQRQQTHLIATQQAQMLQFFAHHPQPMWIYDVATHAFLDVNQAAVQEYGYSRAEFLAMTLQEIRPSDEIPRPQDNLSRPHLPLEQSGIGLHQRKNGSLMNVEIVSHQTRYAERPAVLALITNVTERQLAERTLIENEQRLNSILSNLDAVVWSQAMPSEQLIYMSAVLEKLVGFALDAAQPPPLLWQAIIHPDDCTRVAEAYEQIKTTGSAQLDYRIYHKNGSTRWVNARGWLVYNEHGTVCRLDGIIADITTQKQVEEQLIAHEERLNGILNNIEDMVWSAEYGTERPIYVNNAVETIYGITPAEFTKTPQLWMDLIHPEDLAKFLETSIIAMEEGFRTVEYRIIRPDKQVRRVRDRLRIVLDDDESVLRLDGFITDMTVQGEIEQRQREAEQLQVELQKAHDLRVMRNEFISMLSHDFRNPLSVITSSTDILLRHYQRLEPEKREAQLNKIKVQVQRMVTLLEDILLLTRTEAVGIELQAGMVDIVALCQELVDDTRQTTGTQHTIAFDTSAPNLLLNADSKLLRRAIGNLLSNAVKYTPTGGMIHFSLAAAENTITVAIADTGIGIPKQHLPHLFEAFHRGDNVGNIPGTGLGLAITKQAVELHKGHITVSSQPGRGTEFLVTLPQLSLSPGTAQK